MQISVWCRFKERSSIYRHVKFKKKIKISGPNTWSRQAIFVGGKFGENRVIFKFKIPIENIC